MRHGVVGEKRRVKKIGRVVCAQPACYIALSIVIASVVVLPIPRASLTGSPCPGTLRYRVYLQDTRARSIPGSQDVQPPHPVSCVWLSSPAATLLVLLRFPAGAQTTLTCLFSDDALYHSAGLYHADCRPHTPSRRQPLAYNDDACEKLWAVTERLIAEAKAKALTPVA